MKMVFIANYLKLISHKIIKSNLCNMLNKALRDYEMDHNAKGK